MRKKICTDCHIEKTIRHFPHHVNTHNTDTVYYGSKCDDCMIVRMNRWREENRDRYLAYQREYQRKKYRESHPNIKTRV